MQAYVGFVLILVVSAIVTRTVVSVPGDVDEELDPFDMVRFDHASMKMRKSPDPVEKKSTETEPELKLKPVSKPSEPADPEPPSSTSGKIEDEAPSVKKEEEVVTQAPATNPSEPAVPSCPALSLFQQLISRLLRLVRGKVIQTDENAPSELCVRLQLTPSQLDALENFREDPSSDRVFTAHDILIEAIQSAHPVDSSDPSMHNLWFEETFGVTVEKAVQICFLFVLLLVLVVCLSRLRFSWALFRWAVFITILLSVAMTWYRLYKGEVAKQHSAMMKDLPQGCKELPEGSGAWGKLGNLFSNYFTFQQDTCVEYYEHLYMDPIVKVSPMEALAVAVVQTILKPMRTVGKEISEFIRALVKDLPVQWQMVSLVSVFGSFALFMFLACGYKIRVPFLLAIEPSRPSDTSSDMKALENQLHDLRTRLEKAEHSQNFAALPQPVQTVRAISHGAACCNITASHATQGGPQTRMETRHQECAHLPATVHEEPPEPGINLESVGLPAEESKQPHLVGINLIDTIPQNQNTPTDKIEWQDKGTDAKVASLQECDGVKIRNSAAAKNDTVPLSAERTALFEGTETVGGASL